MLDRIALHQSRLSTPGLVLDGRGVALGARGLILLPSIDRLVALLSVYTQTRTLDDLAASLEIRVLVTRVGAHPLTLEFPAQSSDRMDHLAEIARLVGGSTFTGTSRHFVQYRDNVAPFGYDVRNLLATDAALALYHDTFTQTYEVDRTIALRALLLRLMPREDRARRPDTNARLIVAEQGLGSALISYLVRSQVTGEACVVEWPASSAFDDAPVRRWMVRTGDLPKRMEPLFRSTPGLSIFLPTAAGAAVEMGFRHPIELAACPVFDAAGLVLFRGRAGEPWVVDRLPPFGDLTAFARVEFHAKAQAPPQTKPGRPPDPIRVPLRLTPSSRSRGRITATWIAPDDLPRLRRLAYVLPHAVIARTEVALTPQGAVLRSSDGVDGIPLGTFFTEVHPRIYIATGHEVSPAVGPDALARALRVPTTHAVFIGPRGRPIAIEEAAFSPLEAALLEAAPWEPLAAESISASLEEGFIELKVLPLGLSPLRDAQPPTAEE